MTDNSAAWMPEEGDARGMGITPPPVPFVLVARIDYGIWYALIRECLPSTPGWIDFEVQDLSPASVMYTLRQSELGNLGTLKLLSVGRGLCYLYVDAPPRPTREEAGIQWPDGLLRTAYGSTEDSPEQKAALNRVWEIEREAIEALYQKRQYHKERVLQEMFQKLEAFPAWQDARAPDTNVPSPDEFMDRWEASADNDDGQAFLRKDAKERAGKAHWLMTEGGKGKTEAIEEAGTTFDTYHKWLKLYGPARGNLT